MRHDNHDAAPRPHSQNRLGQRLFTFMIQIRVRLIQDDQERIAIEGARKRNTLPLPGRERHSPFPDARLVALR